MELIDVNQFSFETAKPSLNHDVVCPSGFHVHALPDVQRFQQLLILVAGELASLVRIEDRWGPELLYGTAYSIRNRLDTQSIGTIPTL